MNLNKIFLQHCEDNKYEINQNQIEIINNLKDFYDDNFNVKYDNKLPYYKDGNIYKPIRIGCNLNNNKCTF